MTTASFPALYMTSLSRLAAIPVMLDYDREAAYYDITSGGDARPNAAAGAIGRLLPPAADRIADVGCGTGIVTVRVRPGPTARRLTGRAAQGLLSASRPCCFMIVDSSGRYLARTVHDHGIQRRAGRGSGEVAG